MKDKKRTLQIGLVWSLIFLGWLVPSLFITNWKFNPYSPRDWGFVMDEFTMGWTLKSTSDWIFIILIFLIIPAWLLGWRLCLNVQWKKLYQSIRAKILYFLHGKKNEKKEIKKAKLKPRAAHNKVRPAPLSPISRSAPSAGAAVAKSAAAQSKKSPPPPAASTPAFLTPEEMDTPIDDIQLPETIRLEENLPQIMQSAGYKIIQGPTIGNKMFDYMALDGEKILLCLCDTEQGDWLVDEDNFGGDAPLWFSETAHRTSPIFEMVQVVKSFAEKLQKRNLKYDVVPMFIEKSGTLINADEMAPIWKKMEVIVCRTDLGGPSELPGFNDALPPSDTPIEDAGLRAVQDLL